MTVTSKYSWPGYKQDRVCNKHGRSQPSQPNMLALKYVTRPMSSVGLDLFFWKGKNYLIMVEHVSGLPMYKVMRRTIAFSVT